MRSQNDLRSIFRIWLRYFAVFRKDLLYGIVTTFTEPILYLLAFGYGLGSMLKTVQFNGVEVTYRQFVYAGIVAQAVLFQSFFDAAYGSFIRMYYQKIFKAMATTPITLSEVLWGEILWDASRATFGSSAVLLVGVASGNFSATGALSALPVCFLGALVFSGMGLLTAALATSIESINYPQYLLVFPMFLFCGVYFPLEQLPEWTRLLVWLLPLTPLSQAIRGLTLDLAFPWWSIPLLAVWAGILITVARRAMTRRLIH